MHPVFTKFRARQRSGEGVARRNGRPKAVFGEPISSLPPLRFDLKTSENFKGAEKKRTLQKHPFGRPFLRTGRRLLCTFGAHPKMKGFSRNSPPYRSAPKGRQQMGETGFCKNLRFPAKICGFLRFSAQICDSQIP